MNNAHLAHLRQCNALSKIASLPPEILVNILAFSSRCGAQDLDIVRWTHVCSYIRDVAVSTPQLWSYLPVRITLCLNVLQMMLSRSQNTLLDVEVCLVSPLRMNHALVSALEVLLRDAQRLRRLHLTCSAAVISRCLRDNPASHLQSLSIEFRDDVDGVGHQDLLITHEIFGGVTPVPRGLALGEGALLWSSSIFTGLTCLRITDLDDDTALTRDQFLDTLRVSNKLEALHLSGCLIGVLEEPNMEALHHNHVTLSCLKLLEIRCMDIKSYGFIITQLRFPSDTRVRILEISGQELGELGARSRSILPSKLFTEPYHSSTPSRSFVLRRSTVGVTSYDRFLEGSEWYKFSPSGDEAHVEASFACATDINAYDHVPHVDRLPMSDVHTLKFVGFPPQDFMFWDGIFRQAAHVRRLFIGVDLDNRGNLSFLLWALIPSSTHGYLDPPLLPHLSELHFSLYQRKNVKGVTPGILKTVLNARASAGSKITRFTMRASEHIRLGFLACFGGAIMVFDKKDLLTAAFCR